MAAAVVGRPNGQTIGLEPSTDLVLVLGRDLVDRQLLHDFTLVGNVTSPGGSATTEPCPSLQADASGVFEVLVSPDGSNWSAIGNWSQANDRFDIGCAELKTTRWIRVRGLRDATAQLDSVEFAADTCQELP